MSETSFKKYFLNEAEVKPQDKTEQKKIKKISKIDDNFETELRKYFKIKEIIYSSFGIQIDFYKKINADEINAILDPKIKVKFKDKSIFVEF